MLGNVVHPEDHSAARRRRKVGSHRRDQPVLDADVDQRTQEGFARHPDQNRQPVVAQFIDPGDSLDILPRGLAEPHARIEDDALLRDAGGIRQRERAIEETADVGQNIDRRVLLWAIGRLRR